MLQLDELLDRKPAQLSGGQRQRVAIGRALVREPQVFLFDEPLSNLDAMLRVQMRVEIAKLHQDLSATMIYVTHDQVEAMTLADKIVVLDRGVISQVGTPMELYQSPAEQVRRLLHRLADDELRRRQAEGRRGPEHHRRPPRRPGPHGQDAQGHGQGATPVDRGRHPAGACPAAPAGDPRASLAGTVQILERLGNATIMYVATPAGQIVIQDDGDVRASAGENVGVIFDPARVHVFTQDSQVV